MAKDKKKEEGGTALKLPTPRLKKILADEDFRAGRISTRFMERFLDK